ncbi:hypothetical protein LCDVSa017R [Lymphocystis disease virus 3]|uniref:Bcl-2 Bcl-2 homology region 1-3 domain-containing protein n=1 Tax=Lymphocystis disease virus 3 TaxID=2560566 RepID=A0A1B2RVS4_9VIRU|nr:hypothetical protein BZK12_gp017 [Lymphocystis disease virus Sa]AOC55101.1 hypothetical protein LCDVSa017R [Lymphocystis disease virus 3]
MTMSFSVYVDERQRQFVNRYLESETSQIFHRFFRNRFLFCNIEKAALKDLNSFVRNDRSYQRVLKKLPFENKKDVRFICAVADDIFSDDEVNWGKILGLISFSELMTQNLKIKKDRSKAFKRIVFSYLSLHQKDWMAERCGEPYILQPGELFLAIKTIGACVLICTGIGALLSLWIRKE